MEYRIARMGGSQSVPFVLLFILPSFSFVYIDPVGKPKGGSGCLSAIFFLLHL
jgi:hypothetical protein